MFGLCQCLRACVQAVCCCNLTIRGGFLLGLHGLLGLGLPQLIQLCSQSMTDYTTQSIKDYSPVKQVYVSSAQTLKTLL